MARGFLSGFVVGAAVFVCAAALMSVFSGPPLPPEFAADPPVASDVPSDGTVPLDLSLRAEDDPRRPARVGMEVPKAAATPEIADDATRPAGRPETAEPAADVVAPVPDTGETVTVDQIVPVRPRSNVAAPGAPATDNQAAIVTEPPRSSGVGSLSVPSLPSGETVLRSPAAEALDAPPAPGAEPGVAGLSGGLAPSAPGQLDQPSISADTAPNPGIPSPGAAVAPPNPDPTDHSTAEADQVLGKPSPPGAGTDAPVMPGPDDDATAPDGGAADASAETGTVGDSDDRRASAAPLPQAGDASGAGNGNERLAIGTPATSLLDRNAGDDTETASEGSGGDENAAEAEPPALLHNAEPFDAPEGQPLISIVLMDTGLNLDEGPVGLAALGSFPYPLSFAVDTSLPDASERAARYRALGLEVMAMVDLPENLTASDTEVALTALLDRVPEAVAVLEGPASGLQGSGEMSSQVAAILMETGHGIVWRPSGLGTAQRHSVRAGVPSRTLYRDFDSAEQTPIVIRRFLDQAALRAGQEGAVIVAGRLRPDTISALLIWALQDRLSRVTVAPVSAALLAEPEES